MTPNRRSMITVLVALVAGALAAALFWDRDGFEVALWIAGVVIAATGLLAVFPRGQTAAAPPVTSMPASRTDRLLSVLRKPWVNSVAVAAVVAPVMIAVVAFVQRNEHPQPPVGTSPTEQRTSAGPRPPADIAVSSATVLAGSSLTVNGGNFVPGETVKIELYQGADLTRFDGPYEIGSPEADDRGKISTRVTVHEEICCTGATVRLVVAGSQSHRQAEKIITLG